MRLGAFVEYGNDVQLLHVESNCFIGALRQIAEEDNTCNKVELITNGGRSVYFRALGGFKYKQVGDRIHYDDQIVLQNLKTGYYLHVTEKILDVEAIEGSIPSHIKKSQ